MWAAIIPVKATAEAKSRLSSVLGLEARRALALGMLVRVAQTAAAAGCDVWVAGGDGPVADLCRRLGCRWLPDAGGLNASVADGLRRAWAAGYAAALVVPADVAWVRAADLRDLTGAARPGAVVLVPSPDGGTNAMALWLPPRVVPAFGPGSFRRHCRQARRAGLEVVERRPPGLLRDVDGPEDLTPQLLADCLKWFSRLA